MAKYRLSDSIVRRLQPPSRGLRIDSDIALRGFGVRVLESGSRSFVLSYTPPTGKRSVHTIGPFTGYGGDETHANPDRLCRNAALWSLARLTSLLLQRPRT